MQIKQHIHALNVPQRGRGLLGGSNLQLHEQVVKGEGVVTDQVVQQLAQHRHVRHQLLRARRCAVPLRLQLAVYSVSLKFKLNVLFIFGT